MRIAILTDNPPIGGRDPGSFFDLRALENLLSEHELLRIHQSPTPDTLAALRKQDLILVAGIEALGTGRPASFGFTAEQLRGLAKPVIAIGLTVQSANVTMHERQLLAFFAQTAGEISVTDARSKHFIDDILGPGAATLTGPGSLLLREKPLTHPEPRVVFCPGGTHGVSRKLYDRLRKVATTLFMAQHQEDLALGALPGISTLYSPHFPLIHLKALVSASSILSFRLEPVLAGIANGVPSFLICLDEHTKSIAESLAIPHVAFDPKLRAEQLHEMFDKAIANYPWEEIRRRAEVFERRQIAYLEERGVTSSTKPQLSIVNPEEKLSICCIADRNYLPFFKGFIENLIAVHDGPVDLHLLALGSGIREFVQTQYPELNITVHELEDVWERHELPNIVSRPITHQAYASKAKLLQKVLSRSHGPVFYFDLDIFFFRSPLSLIDAIKGHSVLLFPNWNDYLQDSKSYGIFNAGMIGIAPGAETFLTWWSQLCLFEYNEDSREGYFVDQGFLDMVQLYFDGVKIYKGCDHNVARWNLASTVSSFQPKGAWAPQLRAHREIATFHAALPDSLGLFELKFSWDQIVNFFAPIPWHAHSSALRQLTVQQQKSHWLALSRLEFACSALRGLFGLKIDPWKPSVSNFFLHGHGSLPLKACAYLHYKWRMLFRRTKTLVNPRPAPSPFWIQLQRNLLFEHWNEDSTRPMLPWMFDQPRRYVPRPEREGADIIRRR